MVEVVVAMLHVVLLLPHWNYKWKIGISCRVIISLEK